MSIFEAIVCGITQGACEFLPVSSSGHLALLHGMLGFTAGENDILFDVLLHLGTLFSVVLIYGKDIFGMIRAVPSLFCKALSGKLRFDFLNESERVLVSLFFATLPMFAAVFVRNKVELLSDYPRAVGALLVINGFVLILGELIKHKDGRHPLGALSSIGIGLFQLAAVLPGLSRSGTTIATGLLLGNKKESVAQFSFLMVLAPILGEALLEVVKGEFGGGVALLPLVAGFVTAFVTGALACKFMLEIVKRGKLIWFAIYCALAGVVTIVTQLI